ncbi:MAG: hypothetical protein WBD31_04230 [Rubripirellula sp.]
MLLLDGEDQDDASRILADWRSRSCPRRGRTGRPTDDAGQADLVALRAARATVREDITLYWTDGGPRKWRLQRGTIRLGGSLRLLASSAFRKSRT